MAVQVTDAPGASEAAPSGHVMTGTVPVPENAVSLTFTFFNVTGPVFVTTKLYVTESPALFTVVGEADFTKLIADETAKWGKVIREAGIKPQ